MVAEEAVILVWTSDNLCKVRPERCAQAVAPVNSRVTSQLISSTELHITDIIPTTANTW